jgi:hypothetical protein
MPIDFLAPVGCAMVWVSCHFDLLADDLPQIGDAGFFNLSPLRDGSHIAAGRL